MTFNPDDIFECQKCGDCCKGYGGTFVTESDIEAISAYIGETPARFVEEYCRFSGGRPLLAQGDDGFCAFWDKICTIHPVKPKMCRAWPFIESVLADTSNWRIMANSCPGIKTDVSDEAVYACVQQEIAKRGNP